MKARFSLRLLFAFAVVLACTGSAFAQSNAQLSGTVTDASGGIIAKATVTLQDVGTNVTYTATSNDSGLYVFPNLPPGTYNLKASYTSFAPFAQSGIVLNVAESATINVTLQVATEGEKVVVTTALPTIEPTKTEISQVVGTQQIQSLPTSDRLFTDFALLTPGVAMSRTSLGTTFTEFETTQISFGGMRSFSNEITVDGADFVNELSGVQRATPPQDSVQEFRVVNNSFGAEYGRAIGGIVNVVTKSGTNTLHGSVYEYFENNATDARTLLQPAPLPDVWRQNQFGATLGGPIKKDKTFFFANYEGHRNAYSPTFAPDLYNNITNIDIAKGYMGLAPEGGRAGFAGLESTLRTNDNDYGFVRLDHEINSNNHLAIRYNVEDARDFGELIGATEDGGGIGTPSGGRDLFVRDQSIVGTLSSVITPNVVNTALVQYARRHYNFPGETGEPDLSVVNDLELGHNFGTYDAIYESRIEVNDSVSWVKGNHIAKFGFDGNYIWDQNNYPGFTPERILFPNLDCMFAFANTVSAITTGTYGSLPTANCPLPPQADGVSFLYQGIALPRANCPGLTVCANGFYNGYVPAPATGAGFGSGWPNAFPTNLYNNYAYDLNHGYWGVFAQDQWRIKPSLTLNYGLRWDVETGLSNVVDSYYGAFQPRVGLAWSPDNKTVVRAGFGVFFDRNNMTFFFTTGNQKTVPGYFCGNGATPSDCTGLAPVTVPMIRKGAQNGGWQLGGTPGYPGTPALPCAVVGLPATACPAQQDGTINIAALTAFGTMTGAPYSPETLTGPCVLVNEAPSGACGVGSGGIQKNGKLPYAEQASIEIDREIGGGFAINLAYLFVGAHRLVRGNNLNVPCPIGPGGVPLTNPNNAPDAQGWLGNNGALTDCAGTPELSPAFGLGPFFNGLANGAGLEFGVPSVASPSPTISGGLLDYNNNVASSTYNGLTVTAIERWGKYLNLTANYTYSHTTDNGNFTTFINLPPNQFDYASEEANSNQDLRHRFVTNFTLSAPDHGWYRNFQFSSIITLQSGSPFTLFAGQDTLGDLAGLSTDRVGGPPVVGACTSVANCSTMVPRNTYIGDPLYSWDLHIGRYFQLRPNLRMDLGVDGFNILNRPNVEEVNSVYGSPVFCGSTPMIPRHYNDSTTLAIQRGSVSCATQQAAVNPGAWLAAGLFPFSIPNTPTAGQFPVTLPNNPNPVFGTPRVMLNPRQFQFSAKFTF
ncbi:MAG: carboxypeptidase regulatory-like domain-containing protein [Candidatus Acidiferrales bacterium]